jgi:hypothetical protein
MIERARFKLGYHPSASPKKMVSALIALQNRIDTSPTPFGLDQAVESACLSVLVPKPPRLVCSQPAFAEI